MKRRSFFASMAYVFGAVALPSLPAIAANVVEVAGTSVADLREEPEDDDFNAGFWGNEAAKLPPAVREEKLREYLCTTSVRDRPFWQKDIQWNA